MPGRTPGAPALSEEPSHSIIITTGANRTQKTVPPMTNSNRDAVLSPFGGNGMADTDAGQSAPPDLT